MHTVHAGFSFVADIQQDKIEIVTSLLNELNKDPGGNAKIGFNKIVTTQFASSVILPNQQYQTCMLPAKLFFATSYVGPLKNHLQELVQHGAQGLRELMQFCTDFPEAAKTDDAALVKYLKSHNLSSTFYSGMQYITHDDIGRENSLREFIEDYIDKVQESGELDGCTALQTQEKIQNAVGSKFDWAKNIWKKSFLDYWLIWGSTIISLIIVAILIGGGIIWIINKNPIGGWLGFTFLAIISAAIFIIISFRINELTPQPVDIRQPNDIVRAIDISQQHPVINEMTISGALKDGWVHVVFLFIFLKIIWLIKGTIYIPTVVTARWVMVDKGKRLVFISNFLNLSDGYVRDFIDSKTRASKINLSFGQGKGYPGTKWVFGKGALNNPEGFMNVVEKNQIITPFWYWPYHYLSVANINNNRQIYLGLFAKLSEKDAQKWLQLF